MLKKIFIYIIILLFSYNLFLISTVSADAVSLDSQVKINSVTNWATNDRLSIFESFDVFLDPGEMSWADGLKNTILLIAKDVKNLFYAVAIIYFLIILKNDLKIIKNDWFG
jgi:hypothetical protein